MDTIGLFLYDVLSHAKGTLTEPETLSITHHLRFKRFATKAPRSSERAGGCSLARSAERNEDQRSRKVQVNG